MLMKPAVVAATERRFKQADFSPVALDKKLGDGPISMTPERRQTRMRQLLAETGDRKSTRLNSSHLRRSRMPSSA